MNVKLNMSEHPCSWCDTDKPATYEITVDGWTDHACLDHAALHFPDSGITPANGVTYARTHLLSSSREIVSAMAAYVGKEMTAHVYDRGTVKPCRILLVSVGGDCVAFWYKGKRFTMDAFDVFGNQCTHVHN